MRRVGAALAAALLVLGMLPAVAAAAEPTFETPAATATFGTGITFTQAFDSPLPLARVEALLTFPSSIGPFVTQVEGATSAGRHELTFRWSTSADGHLVPNTPVSVRWRLVPEDRALAPSVGPAATVTYADTRFDWRTVEGDLVHLHWYEGSEAFGRAALEIGEKGVRDAQEFLGVTLAEPVDFYVYADQAAFYDALGPGTRENVVGEAHSDIGTMFALIAPGDVGGAEVRRIVPHELTHLVFNTAVDNPYHGPPRWLNEGVAVYLTEGYKGSDRSDVEAAASDGRLMPLLAIGGFFPTTYERFSLAYAESVSAVDFLVREKGTDALVSLVNSYADGVSDDEAFTAAVGTDVAGFEASWLADLGAAAPVKHGPQPAPAGPLPAGWDGGASPQPAPAAPADTSPLGQGWVVILAAVAGLLVGGSVAYVLRRRARTEPGAPETSAWVVPPGGSALPDASTTATGPATAEAPTTAAAPTTAEPPTRLESPAMLAGPGDEAP